MADRVALLPLLFALAPLAASGWRGLRRIVAAGAICFALLAAWIYWTIARADPASTASPRRSSMAFVVASAVALAAGAAGRAAGLALLARGHSRAGVIWTDVAALALPLAFLLHFRLI